MKTIFVTQSVFVLLFILLLCLVHQSLGAFYQFGYQVDTLDTGDYHGHMEQQDGYVKNGEFKVRLPDGRLQITSYQADEAGFRPKISYEIDPLFVPPPAEPIIPFIPDKKFIKRPPPKSYDAIPQSYVPPSINYDPRGYKNPHHFPEKPAINYVTPKPHHDNIPGVGYKAPKKPGILYAPPSPSPPEVGYEAPKNVAILYAPPSSSAPVKTPSIVYAPPSPAPYSPPDPGYEVPQNPNALYAPPSPAPYAPPPPNIYQPPKSEYNYEVPIINYKPQASYLPPDYSEHSLNTNYLSPEMYTPSIERYDNPDEDRYTQHFQSHDQKYFLVPIRQEHGEEPVLALLVRKKE